MQYLPVLQDNISDEYIDITSPQEKIGSIQINIKTNCEPFTTITHDNIDFT